jgi:hypothetical protein
MVYYLRKDGHGRLVRDEEVKDVAESSHPIEKQAKEE